MRKILTYTLPIALAAALGTVSVAAEPTTGSLMPSTQLLADSCAACHGTDGNSPGPISELDNLEVDKFIEKMKKFKYKEGAGRIMGPIARGLSDEQIRAVAEHFHTFNR